MKTLNRTIIIFVLLMRLASFVVGQPNPSEHNYVDLGLPSGTLWATCNVGANTPEEFGDYFAWGETTTKTTYNWKTYNHCHGDFIKLTKYCNQSSFGYNHFTDDLTTLQDCDDAATINLGIEWCMPTADQWSELILNTKNTWTTQNGVKGRLFTANNGNSLFLPAAGGRTDDNLSGVGTVGIYWSGSLDTDHLGYARFFCFFFNLYEMGYNPRSYGHSIRPVRSGKTLTQDKALTQDNDTLASNNASPQTTNPPETLPKVYANAYDGFVNIRQAPQNKTPVLGVLRNGPKGAILLGIEGDWTKINCNGIVGYVLSKYVQDTPTKEYRKE